MNEEVIRISPVKTLSRKPFMLMLQDDSGELLPTRLDPELVNSDNAIIVLDEYNDTCWVWIGQNVNMPTRMHALRMARSLQKSGYKVGVTTIGMATSRLVEMLERDAGDAEVADNIASFRHAIQGGWRFEDEVLAFDESYSSGRDAPAPSPSPVEAAPPTIETVPTPEPVATPGPVTVGRTEPIHAEPVPPAEVRIGGAEKKAAFLLYSIASNTDLVYTERIERNGVMGLKIEAPGVLVIEALMDGNDLRISPSHFGDSDDASRIRAHYESLTRGM